MSFNVRDVFNRQYSHKDLRNIRDAEMQRLEAADEFMFTYDTDTDLVPMLSCKFCPTNPDLIATSNDDGYVAWLRSKRAGGTRVIHRAHHNSVFDIVWAPNEIKLLTLSGDKTAKLWDLPGSAECISNFAAHTNCVKCADFRPQDPATFVTGSRDGTVLVWDSRVRADPQSGIPVKYDQIIESAAADPNVKRRLNAKAFPVTGVAFQDNNTLLTCGSTDEYIRVWDMRKTYRQGKAVNPKIRIKTPRFGFTGIKLSPDANLLYASSRNGPIYCYNINSTDPKLVAVFKGHDAGSYYIKTGLSRDGCYLISGSSSNDICVWRTTGAMLGREPRDPLVRLISHGCEVTGVDFSPFETTTLISCSDDGSLKKWTPTRSLEEDVLRLDKEMSMKFHITPLPEQTPIIEEVVENRIENKPSTSQLLEGDVAGTMKVEKEATTKDGNEATTKEENEAITKDGNEATTKVEKEATTKDGNEATTNEENEATTNGGADVIRSINVRLREATPPRTVINVSSNPISKRKSNSQHGSPIKPSSSKRIALSPRKQVDVDYRSPTANLPNYVIDGTGPAHRCTRSRQKENDWLTQMGKLSASKQLDSDEKSRGSKEKSQAKSGRRLQTSGKSKKTLLHYYKKS